MIYNVKDNACKMFPSHFKVRDHSGNGLANTPHYLPHNILCSINLVLIIL